MNQWYIHNPEFVLENETHKLLGFWHTNGSPTLGQMTWLCNNQQKKKENLSNCGLCCPDWPQSKIEETMAHEIHTNCNWYSWYSYERSDTGTGELGNKRTNEDHPNYSIIKIGYNTEESPRDLRFAVTLTPVRNHQLVMGLVYVDVLILRVGNLYVVCLMEDWTNDRGKWISLKSDFIERI